MRCTPCLPIVIGLLMLLQPLHQPLAQQPAPTEPALTEPTPESTPEAIMDTLRIVALVPEGTPTVYLAGNLAALGPWRPGHFPMSGQGHRRQADLPVARGTTVEFKLSLGSWATQALDGQGNVPPQLNRGDGRRHHRGG